MLAARRTHMRRNADAKSFQEVFDPKILIQKANRLQRLVRNISFPTEGDISVSNIYENCSEEFGLTIPITKSESNLSELVFDTSAFDFPYISWSP